MFAVLLWHFSLYFFPSTSLLEAEEKDVVSVPKTGADDEESRLIFNQKIYSHTHIHKSQMYTCIFKHTYINMDAYQNMHEHMFTYILTYIPVYLHRHILTYTSTNQSTCIDLKNNFCVYDVHGCVCKHTCECTCIMEHM